MPDPRVRVPSPTSPVASITPRTIASRATPRLAVRQTDPVSFIPAASLSADGPSTTASSSSTSSTSDSPLFPYPTSDTNDCENCESDASRYTKKAVEGALIVVAVALILTMLMWRTIRLRKSNRPLRDFFRTSPQTNLQRSVSRPPHVPRTTGLPSTRGPPASVIYDSLATPVPLLHRTDGPRRGRGRRTHAGDIDASGRRGTVAHPDDPNEFLPEYDDKDMLPRYQDLVAGPVASGPPVGAGLGRVDDAGRMAGVGAGLGRRPNGDGGESDTNLVVRSTVSEEEHAYPPTSPAVSHDGHSAVQRHG